MKIKYTSKLFIVILIMFLISFLFTSYLTTKRVNDIITESTDTNISNVAKSVANDLNIQTWLSEKDERIKDYIKVLHSKVNDIAYIVVIDMNSVRYSHPNPKKIGQVFNGGDQYRAINGESYISYGYGSLGYSKRAFEPIFYNGEQIGVVAVGNLVSTVTNYQNQQLIFILSIFTIGLILSSTGSWFLTKNIRKSLMGFNLEEIKNEYLNNKMILDEINDGILVVDSNMKITSFNEKAKELFSLDEFITNMDIKDILPEDDLPLVVTKGMEINNRVETIGKHSVIASRLPLYDKVNNEIIGGIAIYKSHHEIRALLDELTGYKEVSKTLRAQKHEFKNKMHVVLGLLMLKEYKLAEEYISSKEIESETLIDYLNEFIKDEKVSALLVGKVIESYEYNTEIILSKDSFLSLEHEPISSEDLIIILGNLISNSLEAINISNKTENKIYLKIIEDKFNIIIEVKDTGDGIEDSIVDKIFERGITTKDKERGIGLSLVSHVVQKYSGKKSVKTNNDGTKVEIILKKGKNND